MYQGIYPTDNFTWVDSLIISAIAIVIVFLVLIIVIAITHGIKLGTDAVDGKMSIKASKNNKIIEEDKDALVASLVATIDYHKETGKDAKLISIEKIDE